MSIVQKKKLQKTVNGNKELNFDAESEIEILKSKLKYISNENDLLEKRLKYALSKEKKGNQRIPQKIISVNETSPLLTKLENRLQYNGLGYENVGLDQLKFDNEEMLNINGDIFADSTYGIEQAIEKYLDSKNAEQNRNSLYQSKNKNDFEKYQKTKENIVAINKIIDDAEKLKLPSSVLKPIIKERSEYKSIIATFEHKQTKYIDSVVEKLSKEKTRRKMDVDDIDLESLFHDIKIPIYFTITESNNSYSLSLQTTNSINSNNKTIMEYIIQTAKDKSKQKSKIAREIKEIDIISKGELVGILNYRVRFFKDDYTYDDFLTFENELKKQIVSVYSNTVLKTLGAKINFNSEHLLSCQENYIENIVDVEHETTKYKLPVNEIAKRRDLLLEFFKDNEVYERKNMMTFMTEKVKGYNKDHLQCDLKNSIKNNEIVRITTCYPSKYTKPTDLNQGINHNKQKVLQVLENKPNKNYRSRDVYDNINSNSNISPALVYYYLQQLVDDGIISRKKKNGNVKYRLSNNIDAEKNVR